MPCTLPSRVPSNDHPADVHKTDNVCCKRSCSRVHCSRRSRSRASSEARAPCKLPVSSARRDRLAAIALESSTDVASTKGCGISRGLATVEGSCNMFTPDHQTGVQAGLRFRSRRDRRPVPRRNENAGGVSRVIRDLPSARQGDEFPLWAQAFRASGSSIWSCYPLRKSNNLFASKVNRQKRLAKFLMRRRTETSPNSAEADAQKKPRPPIREPGSQTRPPRSSPD